MNVFWQELKSHLLSLIIWCVSMIGFLFMCMVKFDTLAKGGAETEKLIAQFPHTLQVVFGMNGLDIATISGYFGICFIFIMILVAVHAGLLGVNVLAREAQTKTTEFLYTKPVPRSRVITAKLCAGLVQLMILWAATYIGSVWSISSVSTMHGFTADLAVFMAATALIQLTFFAFGMLFAAVSKSPYSPARWMAGLVFATYILSVVAQFEHYGWLRYISLFSYFNAVDILQAGALKQAYVVVCVVVVPAAFSATYRAYRRRDLLL